MEGYQKTRFAGISKKWFQKSLLDTILGGFWDQVGAQKSPKKGSKPPKNHVQDSIRKNISFNKKRLLHKSCVHEKLVVFTSFLGPINRIEDRRSADYRRQPTTTDSKLVTRDKKTSNCQETGDK